MSEWKDAVERAEKQSVYDDLGVLIELAEASAPYKKGYAWAVNAVARARDMRVAALVAMGGTAGLSAPEREVA